MKNLVKKCEWIKIARKCEWMVLDQLANEKDEASEWKLNNYRNYGIAKC